MREVHAWEPDANSGEPALGLHENSSPLTSSTPASPTAALSLALARSAGAGAMLREHG
jgi:hypothetical protein